MALPRSARCQASARNAPHNCAQHGPLYPLRPGLSRPRLPLLPLLPFLSLCLLLCTAPPAVSWIAHSTRISSICRSPNPNPNPNRNPNPNPTFAAAPLLTLPPRHPALAADTTHASRRRTRALALPITATSLITLTSNPNPNPNPNPARYPEGSAGIPLGRMVRYMRGRSQEHPTPNPNANPNPTLNPARAPRKTLKKAFSWHSLLSPLQHGEYRYTLDALGKSVWL